ncbi:uncharacterized protein METZ01_LOCUS315539, partial [marine metagenome]
MEYSLTPMFGASSAFALAFAAV